MLSVLYPIERGLIKHWDQLAYFFKSISDALKMKLEGNSILLIDTFNNEKEDRKVCQTDV